MKKVWTQAELVSMDTGPFKALTMAIDSICGENPSWAWGPFGLNLRRVGDGPGWTPIRWAIYKDVEGSIVLEWD